MLNGTKINVYRMSGAGNLFSALDGRKLQLDESLFPSLAQALCTRSEYNNFQADGLFIIFPGTDGADYSVKFYNPDGSSGMMCGNAGRCSIHLARALGFSYKKVGAAAIFSMAGKIYKGIYDKVSSIFFDPAKEHKKDINLSAEGLNFTGSFFDVGADHYVCEIPGISSLEEFKNFDINKYGKAIRFHETFAPKGVNANFVFEFENKIYLRTFERGVEGETGACGTGAVSTALYLYDKSPEVNKYSIVPTSGQELNLTVKITNENIERIELKGPAEILEIIEITINI